MLGVQFGRMAERSVEGVQPRALRPDTFPHRAKQSTFELLEASRELGAVGRDGFRGRGRSRGAMVAHEVGEGDVGFVSYADDDRRAGVGDRAGYAFLVEGPQVFEASSPASDDQDVTSPEGIQLAYGMGDPRSRGSALNAGRRHDHGQ